MSQDQGTTTPSGADSWKIILAIFGIANLGNGLWMLADPPHWYTTLPAGVPDTGPLNEHFIRDIGCIFTLMGGALVVAAFRKTWRAPALLLATGFSVLHGLVHVLDTMRGLLGPEHWMIDFPGVYAPAIALVVLTGVYLRQAE